METLPNLVEQLANRSIDRRQFLRRALALGLSLPAASAILAACAPAATPTPAPTAKPAAPAPTAAPKPTTAPAAAPTAAPAAKPTTAPAAQPTAAPKPTTAAAPAAKVPPPPSPKPTKLDKVSYGLVSWNPLHWVIMVAGEKKLMEPYGIELDLVLTRSAVAGTQAMAAGSLDIGTTTPSAAWALQEKSPEYKQVAQTVIGNAYSIVAQPEIKSLEDLKGKIIAASSTSSGAEVETFKIILNEKGLQYPRDYDILVSGSVAERTAAVLANQVAATGMIPPQTFDLVARGKKVLAQAWTYPFFKDATSVTLLSKQQWYTEKKDIAIRFMQAYVAATAWVYDPKNRAEVVKVMVDLIKTDPKFAEQTYDQFIVDMKAYPLNIRVDPKQIGQAYDNIKKIGGSVPADPMKIADNSIVDAALK